MLLLSLTLSLAACIAAPFVARRMGRQAGLVLAVPLVVAAVLALLAWNPRTFAVATLPWIPELGAEFALRLDGLSLVFTLLVLLIGALVLVYSARYLGQRHNHATFYLLMTGFAAAMLGLVLADDVVVFYVAWEATTFCSFFLIARSGRHAQEPAIRTLLVTVAGGLSLLTAICIMVVLTGTTRISAILAHPLWQREDGWVVAIAALLAIAAFTKSAQFPFQSWLPDSMVAITPVSTYLHAAAMVKAGIYLLLRFSPVLAGMPVWQLMLITSGLITALFGAVAALRRHDLKELLAFSTVSQLGLLVMLIGVGTPAALTAAVLHTIAHALLKSALFMFVGIIDHQAGTRDLRLLAHLRRHMPLTMAMMALAAASMAGIPPLLGFVSKESMIEALLSSGLPGAVPMLLVAGMATTSVLTFAYAGRLILGAFGHGAGVPTGDFRAPARELRGDRPVQEAAPLFVAAPVVTSGAGLLLGLAPFLLDGLTGAGASAAIGQQVQPHLALWHGLNTALLISLTIIALGTVLILLRRSINALLSPLSFPFSGLATIDAMRKGTIRLGSVVGGWAGTTSPHRHLAIPAACLVLIAGVGAVALDNLPATVGSSLQWQDFLLVATIAGGVWAAVSAATRIAAIVVTGVIGFTMTLWFFTLGAADVAITQLMVEILTVCVMVLLLRRLPEKFRPGNIREKLPTIALALATGIASFMGVLALTGRREMSRAGEYFMTEGEGLTGGANVVNTILVDFRAFDTLGELTVLGVAGVVVAALLQSRSLLRQRPVKIASTLPLADPAANAVFLQTTFRLLGPLIVVLSVVLMFRGHQQPGGGFVAALVGGAGFALLYLAAPSDFSAKIRWPFLALIGAGVVIGTATGFLGYLRGSFLAPLHVYPFGVHLTSALVFDIGVYLAVLGIVLAALNLLGREHRVSASREIVDAPGDDIHHDDEGRHTHQDAVHAHAGTPPAIDSPPEAQ